MINAKQLKKLNNDYVLLVVNRKHSLSLPQAQGSKSYYMKTNPHLSSYHQVINSNYKDDFLALKYLKNFGLASNNLRALIASGLIQGYKNRTTRAIRFIRKQPLNELGNEIDDADAFLGGNPKIKNKNVGDNIIYIINKRSVKIDCSGTNNYGFSFHLNNQNHPNKPDRLYIFNGLLDMLSFYEMYKHYFMNLLSSGKSKGIIFLTLMQANEIGDEISNFLDKQVLNKSNYKRIVICASVDSKGHDMACQFISDCLNTDNPLHTELPYVRIMTPVTKSNSNFHRNWNSILRDTKKGKYHPNSLSDISNVKTPSKYIKDIVKNIFKLFPKKKHLAKITQFIKSDAEAEHKIFKYKNIRANDRIVLKSRKIAKILSIKKFKIKSHLQNSFEFIIKQLYNTHLDYLSASQLFYFFKANLKENNTTKSVVWENPKNKQVGKLKIAEKEQFYHTMDKLSKVNCSCLIYAIYIAQEAFEMKLENSIDNKSLKVKFHYYRELLNKVHIDDRKQFQIIKGYLNCQYTALKHNRSIFQMLHPNWLWQFTDSYFAKYHNRLINFRDLLTPNEEANIDYVTIRYNNMIYDTTFKKLPSANAKAIFTYMLDIRLSLEKAVPKNVSQLLTKYYEELAKQMMPSKINVIRHAFLRLNKSGPLLTSVRVRKHLGLYAYGKLMEQKNINILDLRNYLPELAKNPQQFKYFLIYFKIAKEEGIYKTDSEVKAIRQKQQKNLRPMSNEEINKRIEDSFN